MIGEPSHVKQLSLNHVCKIELILSSFHLANYFGNTLPSLLFFCLPWSPYLKTIKHTVSFFTPNPWRGVNKFRLHLPYLWPNY
jgi:hypothetical protein